MYKTYLITVIIKGVEITLPMASKTTCEEEALQELVEQAELLYPQAEFVYPAV